MLRGTGIRVQTIVISNRECNETPAESAAQYDLSESLVKEVLIYFWSIWSGFFVLTKVVPIVPELARENELACLEAGLSIDDLLQGLREQRQRYVQKKYGA